MGTNKTFLEKPFDSTEYFYNTTNGRMHLNEVILTIKSFLQEDAKSFYSLVIGSDSQEKSAKNEKNVINLVTAIVVHRKGYGGKYFWQRKDIKKIHTLRQKIYAETMSSLEFASFFVPLLKKSLNGTSSNYKLEIHVDVGEHGDTRDMIKEVVGIVTGNGYVAKTKPEAFGATYIADKHT